MVSEIAMSSDTLFLVSRMYHKNHEEGGNYLIESGTGLFPE